MFVAQTVTIGEQKVCPESELLKFSTTPTPQVENPSDSDSTALGNTIAISTGETRKNVTVNFMKKGTWPESTLRLFFLRCAQQ